MFVALISLWSFKGVFPTVDKMRYREAYTALPTVVQVYRLPVNAQLPPVYAGLLYTASISSILSIAIVNYSKEVIEINLQSEQLGH